jgi:hypothetical protein
MSHMLNGKGWSKFAQNFKRTRRKGCCEFH